MNTRTLTLKLIVAAIAALPLLAHAGSSNTEVTHDGWLQVNGEILTYVGTQAGSIGKTRDQVRAELVAFENNPVSHDGWLDHGNYSVYVGPPAGTVGKTRAEVQAELAAHRASPVAADGWKTVSGFSVYVGQPAPAAAEAQANAGTDSRRQ